MPSSSQSGTDSQRHSNARACASWHSTANGGCVHWIGNPSGDSASTRQVPSETEVTCPALRRVGRIRNGIQMLVLVHLGTSLQWKHSTTHCFLQNAVFPVDIMRTLRRTVTVRSQFPVEKTWSLLVSSCTAVLVDGSTSLELGCGRILHDCSFQPRRRGLRSSAIALRCLLIAARVWNSTADGYGTIAVPSQEDLVFDGQRGYNCAR